MPSKKGTSREKRTTATGWWGREVVAIVLWIFACVNLFVYDADLWILERLPFLRPFHDLRLFVLAGTIAVLWLVLSRNRFRATVAYIIFYPFVVCLWSIPKLAFRNWAIVLAFSPAFYSLFTTFRRNFIFGTLALISGLAILRSTADLLVIGAACVVAVYLSWHYVRRFRMAFTSGTFADLASVIRTKLRNSSNDQLTKRFEKVTALNRESEDYEENYKDALQHSCTISHLLLFSAERVREVAKSRKLDLYFVGAFAYTGLLTVLGFGFIYLAIERVAPGSFEGVSDYSIWQFVAYSFSNLMTSDLSQLRPTSRAAALASYAQLFSTLLLLVILLFVLLTIVRERYKSDLDDVISELLAYAADVEPILAQHLSLTLEDAELWLVKNEDETVHALRKMRGLPELRIPDRQDDD